MITLYSALLLGVVGSVEVVHDYWNTMVAIYQMCQCHGSRWSNRGRYDMYHTSICGSDTSMGEWTEDLPCWKSVRPHPRISKASPVNANPHFWRTNVRQPTKHNTHCTVQILILILTYLSLPMCFSHGHTLFFEEHKIICLRSIGVKSIFFKLIKCILTSTSNIY